jgi:hypothetical protein
MKAGGHARCSKKVTAARCVEAEVLVDVVVGHALGGRLENTDGGDRTTRSTPATFALEQCQLRLGARKQPPTLDVRGATPSRPSSRWNFYGDLFLPQPFTFS